MRCLKTDCKHPAEQTGQCLHRVFGAPASLPVRVRGREMGYHAETLQGLS